MCKGRSDDDFVDGDDERGSGNSCWSLLAFYGDTLVQGWHVCMYSMYVSARLWSLRYSTDNRPDRRSQKFLNDTSY